MTTPTDKSSWQAYIIIKTTLGIQIVNAPLIIPPTMTAIPPKENGRLNMEKLSLSSKTINATINKIAIISAEIGINDHLSGMTPPKKTPERKRMRAAPERIP